MRKKDRSGTAGQQNGDGNNQHQRQEEHERGRIASLELLPSVDPLPHL
jgi:hypothetical protein